ncbi:MAG: outer membrane lipoprotein chaperone LolA [Spongiibacteraceae bacterium]
MRLRVLALILTFFCVPLWALEDVAQLHLNLSTARNLQANFEQEVHDASGQLIQESRGTIALKQPNKIRWESVSPFRYLLVCDGVTLWRYDADMEQLNTEPFDSSMSQAPAMIVGASIEQLSEQFSVQLIKKGKERQFILTPKQESPFTELTLRFNRGKLRAMHFVDALEQTTILTLKDVKYANKLNDSLFVYHGDTPPNS